MTTQQEVAAFEKRTKDRLMIATAVLGVLMQQQRERLDTGEIGMNRTVDEALSWADMLLERQAKSNPHPEMPKMGRLMEIGKEFLKDAQQEQRRMKK